MLILAWFPLTLLLYLRGLLLCSFTDDRHSSKVVKSKEGPPAVRIERANRSHNELDLQQDLFEGSTEVNKARTSDRSVYDTVNISFSKLSITLMWLSPKYWKCHTIVVLAMNLIRSGLVVAILQ